MPPSLLRCSAQSAALCAAVLTLAGMTACPAEQAASTSAAAGSAKTGAQIYADKRCAMCHGEQREGKPPLGPPLRNLAQYWTVDEMVTKYFPDPVSYQFRDPRLNEMLKEYNKMKMPPVTGDPADMRKLAEYLITD